MGISDFLTFIRYPANLPDRYYHWSSKLKFATVILILMLGVNMVIALLQLLLVRWEIIGDAIAPFQKTEYIKALPKFAMFLEFAVIGPILEELAFRGLLQRSSFTLKISLFAIFFLGISWVFDINFYLFGKDTVIIAAISCILVTLTSKSLMSLIHGLLQIRLTKQAILWFGSVVFAYWHYHNFAFGGLSIVSVLLHLSPYFFNGLLLAWIGTRLGIQWAILVHMLNNAWPILLFI